MKQTLVLLSNLNLMDHFLFDEVIEDSQAYQDTLNIILKGAAH